MFKNIVEYGVIKEAFKKDLCTLNIYDLRDFSRDRHRKIDDRPYGGGPGMVMIAEPLDRAVNHIKKINDIRESKLQKIVLLSAGGEKLDQEKLRKMSKLENAILICGRYEGVDQRFIELSVDMEISIGDYVLTGGELPAMVIMDGVIRLIPGVVGKKESIDSESFEAGLLDWPQYTRPPEYRGIKVPEVLSSGDHEEIKKWRIKKSIEITKKIRPDLFDKNN